MSSVFPITDDPRYRRYTASAGQTVFTVPFPFLQGEDLAICFQTAPSEYTIFDPADYSLSGANDPAGGAVTFNTARQAGDIILVLGKAILDRMSSIVRDGRFSSALIDSELDRIRIIEQEFRRDNERSVKVDYGGSSLTLTADLQDGDTLMKEGRRLVPGPNLPALASSLIAQAAAQANRSHDEADRSEAARDIAAGYASDAVSQGNVPIYATTSGIPSLPIPVGITVFRTNGFSAFNDGGGATWVQVSAEPTHDGKLFSGGRWFEIDRNAPVCPKMFGAVGNWTANDTGPIKSMIAGPWKHVDWGDGSLVYRVTETLNVRQTDVKWFGSALIKLDRSGTWHVPLVVVHQTALNFYSAGTLGFDHNAEGATEPAMTSGIFYAALGCLLVMARGSKVDGRFYNAFDCGLAIGSYTWTGDGSAGNPFAAVQYPYEPRDVVVGDPYGENCGCGEHSINSGGKQGAAVNILTASGVVGGNVKAFGCYAGFIVDYAAGASATFASVTCRNGKYDPLTPGGTGMDVYIGASATIGAIYSDNAARNGIVVDHEFGSLDVGIARIFASGLEGVRVSGGKVRGRFDIGHSCLLDPTTKSAFIAIAATELDVDITAWGPYHAYGYRSNNAAVKGAVRLTCLEAKIDPYFAEGREAVFANLKDRITQLQNDALSVGIKGIPSTLSSLQALRWISLGGSEQALAFNLYYDLKAPAGFKYIDNGFGWYMVLGSDGKLKEFYAPNNTSGPGASASPVALSVRGGAGFLRLHSIPQYADDAAAAAGGLEIDRIYRTGSTLKVRVS